MRPKLVRFIVDGFLVISGNDLGVHYSSSMLENLSHWLLFRGLEWLLLEIFRLQ